MMGEESKKRLEDIIVKIREKFEPIFREILTDSSQNLQHLKGFEEISSWYKKSKSKEDVWSTILQDIINKTIEFVPNHFGVIILENVKINSKKTGIKFDLNFQPESIKSYVEFKIKIDGQETHSEKLIFEINSNIAIQDIEIKSENKKKEICLGILSMNLHFLIIQIPFMKLNESIDLGEREIQLDLSELCEDKQND